MFEIFCCVYDAAALAAGGVLLARLRFRGVLRELLMLAFVAAVLVAGIAAITSLNGMFAMLRGLCHGLCCAVLPLLAWRALRIRRDCRWLAVLLLTTTLLGEGLYVFARRVEPFRLEVTQAHLTSPRLAALPRPLRIAVVADLQTDAIGDYEVGVFDRIVAYEPDLVLFLGDYLQLQPPEFGRELPKLQAQLRRLSPPLGMFGVDGDVDVCGADTVFAGTGVTLITDSHAQLPGVPIDVIGLGRWKSRARFLDGSIVRRLQGDRYCILMGHAPDFMMSVIRDGLAVDALMVAGHTHGGQVQIPGFGPLVTLSSVPRWLAGGGTFRRGDTWLCCSRGIGMERGQAPRIRLFCRPQLMLLELGSR